MFNWCQLSSVNIESGPVFYSWLIEVSVNERIPYTCDISRQRPCSDLGKDLAQVPQAYKSGVLCNIRYSSETQLQLESRENSFVHNFRLNNPIVLNFCTEHDIITVSVFCAKFQNDWMTKTGVVDEGNFARFEFRTDILYCTAPGCSEWLSRLKLKYLDIFYHGTAYSQIA